MFNNINTLFYIRDNISHFTLQISRSMSIISISSYRDCDSGTNLASTFQRHSPREFTMQMTLSILICYSVEGSRVLAADWEIFNTGRPTQGHAHRSPYISRLEWYQLWGQLFRIYVQHRCCFGIFDVRGNCNKIFNYVLLNFEILS